MRRTIGLMLAFLALGAAGCKAEQKTAEPVQQEKTTLLPAERPTGAEAFDTAMKAVVTQYLTIQTALAADTLKGVEQAAGEMATLVGAIDTSGITGKNADHYLAVSKTVAEAAKALQSAGSIMDARTHFKTLSKPLTMWASVAQPSGIALAYCSMAPGGWMQAKGPLRNPYYGAQMLECGEFIETGFK